MARGTPLGRLHWNHTVSLCLQNIEFPEFRSGYSSFWTFIRLPRQTQIEQLHNSPLGEGSWEGGVMATPCGLWALLSMQGVLRQANPFRASTVCACDFQMAFAQGWKSPVSLLARTKITSFNQSLSLVLASIKTNVQHITYTGGY